MANWINKTFTLPVIITLLIGFGTGAVWAGTINAEIISLKSIPERMARLEQKTDDIKESLKRIEGYIFN